MNSGNFPFGPIINFGAGGRGSSYFLPGVLDTKHMDASRYQDIKKSSINANAPLEIIGLDDVEDQESIYFSGRHYDRTQLGASVRFALSNAQGEPYKNRKKSPLKRTKSFVRPEILADWHAGMQKWNEFIAIAKKYPQVGQYILSDIFADDELPALVEARHLSRVIAAERAARSALADIEAELGL